MRRLFSSLIGSSKARSRRSSGPATAEGCFAEAESDDAVEMLVHRSSGGESENSGDTSNSRVVGRAWAAVGESIPPRTHPFHLSSIRCQVVRLGLDLE